jgi:hypothetical protein
MEEGGTGQEQEREGVRRKERARPGERVGGADSGSGSGSLLRQWKRRGQLRG